MMSRSSRRAARLPLEVWLSAGGFLGPRDGVARDKERVGERSPCGTRADTREPPIDVSFPACGVQSPQRWDGGPRVGAGVAPFSRHVAAMGLSSLMGSLSCRRRDELS